MDFVKKHYEKLVLGVVLIGLAIAVGFLPFKIDSDKQGLDAMRSSVLFPKVVELTNLDLTVSETALKRLASPAMIDFSAPNKLVNPMPWQKSADDRLIPYNRLGPAMVTVTNMMPLYTRLTLDSIPAPDSTAPRYVIGVVKEAATNPRDRAKKQVGTSANSKQDLFTVGEVRGTKEDPQLVMNMNDTGEQFVLSRSKPFQRVDGWMADLRYDPERKVWSQRRVGAALGFAGEEYIIVAINREEVVLSAKSNGKKWSVKTGAGAAP